MEVLVDTSVWIDYFKGGSKSRAMEFLIDENVLVTNDLILAELIPYLKIQRQHKLIRLLRELRRTPLDIDWSGIVDWQHACLKAGANGIGIPDLIIAQHAKANRVAIYSLDKHFKLLNKVIKVDLYSGMSN
jgi:predicted nucleic acid-binding protein